MVKRKQKLTGKFNPLEKCFDYFKSILEIKEGEGIIIRGNGFIGEIPNRKGQKFFKFRLEILKGKSHKKKRSIKKK